ncbi:MAG: hypothetical protein MRJ96_02660 [Nitrospirales bacterium]|nr:hypothetical protein [Nitrospira sp.]MDR4500343.1 hypothetical protein [Nitrospirales bacterium]
MKIQLCPQCGKESLASTGAFWVCNACRVAITSQALIQDRTPQSFSHRFRKSMA